MKSKSKNIKPCFHLDEPDENGKSEYESLSDLSDLWCDQMGEQADYADEEIKRKTPYSKEEEEIMDHLVAAWNLFVKLDSTHPCHNTDFMNGIHKCQGTLMHRIVQRDYPDDFPTYKN